MLNVIFITISKEYPLSISYFIIYNLLIFIQHFFIIKLINNNILSHILS